MERWRGKVAVVTGASSGIGADIALQLANSGMKVAGLARRVARVEELAKKVKSGTGKIYAFSADMTKEADILAAFKSIKEKLGPVHILVNNAGVAKPTTLVDGDSKLWKTILDTNVMGLCIATREAVKDMRANKIDGHIVHINSMGGHRVPKIPMLNVYPATKYAVTALTETLRQELNSIGSKIKITSVSPGAVNTEMIQSAPEELRKMVPNLPMLKSEDIADAVLYVLGTPPHVQVHELMIQPVNTSF